MRHNHSGNVLESLLSKRVISTTVSAVSLCSHKQYQQHAAINKQQHYNMTSSMILKQSATKMASRALSKQTMKNTRVVHSSPLLVSQRRQDLFYEKYHSSFESTLERVLEMAQLGQDYRNTTFEQVVRSTFSPSHHG